MTSADQEQIKKTTKVFWLFFSIILLVSLFVRVHDIHNRPFHNDEGVNHYFIERTFDLGYYPYSYQNYHGPSYFYATAAFVYFLGDEPLAFRASAIFFGMLMLLHPLRFRKFLGNENVLFSALLIGLSPCLVYYARYAIHESLFVWASMWFALSWYAFWKSKQKIFIFECAISLAILVATKETFPILVFSLLLSTFVLGDIRSLFQVLKEKGSELFWAFLVFMFLVFAFFTGAFQWVKGLREMVMAFPQWVGRGVGDTGHFKPFEYYLLKLIYPTEPYLLLSFLLAVLLLVVARDRLKPFLSEKFAYLRYLLVWTLSSFLVYSFVSYKTPWLAMNFVMPLILVAGFLVQYFADSSAKLSRIALALVVPVVTVVMTLNMIRYNFGSAILPLKLAALKEIKPYGPGNPFSYVHTSPGMMELVDEINKYWEADPEARVLIGAPSYWPLPYYLRHKKGNLAYQNVSSQKPKSKATMQAMDQHSKDFQVMIVNNTIHWEKLGWEKRYYRLHDAQESNTYFRMYQPLD